MRVYISENAFVAMLLSSAEVYKKECLGFLLGYRLEDRFIIENAFGFQAADRRHNGVVYSDAQKRKIDPILEKFDKLQIIGDFHSHTQFGETKGLPIPSKEDIKGMIPSSVHLIIAINNSRKIVYWGENVDGTVSGSVGRFFFKVSAYFLGKRSGALKARIHCPFPPGF